MDDVKVTDAPLHKSVAPEALMVGAAGEDEVVIFTEAIPELPEVPQELLLGVQYTLYVPAVLTVMELPVPALLQT